MTSRVPWREAWERALYAPEGFFLRSRPREHFRTAVTTSDVFAEAIARLARDAGLDAVVDLGAGGGELLARLHHLDPDLHLAGVDLATRPDDLAADIGWGDELPAAVEGLLVAHEWLDDIPCDVVEVDDDGTVRLVEVETDGTEHLGDAYASAWLDRWWPITEPGTRAEVGEPRDVAWADAVARVDGVALAIDYGHTLDARPPFGTLTSFADGREVDVAPDGSRDVSAHVAVDAVAERVGARLDRQRDALTRLGVDGTRPALDLATSDPAAYVAALARAGESAELRARGGWGDFWWLWHDTRVTD